MTRRMLDEFIKLTDHEEYRRKSTWLGTKKYSVRARLNYIMPIYKMDQSNVVEAQNRIVVKRWRKLSQRAQISSKMCNTL